MQTRTKTYQDVNAWKYFFCDELEYDPKGFRKLLSDETTRMALAALADVFEKNSSMNETEVEQTLREVESEYSMGPCKLNQPLRVAVTGVTVGGSMYETAAVIGTGACAARIRKTLALGPAS